MGVGFQAHDAFATPSQGAIQDRTSEHLVSSDKAIVAARKLMEKGIKDIEEGRDPPHVIRSAEENRFPQMLIISDMIPAGRDYTQCARELEAAARSNP